MRIVWLDGKPYLWRDVLKARRDQKKAERQRQLALFELRDDSRPASQCSADGRFSEPTLFEKLMRP